MVGVWKKNLFPERVHCWQDNHISIGLKEDGNSTHPHTKDNHTRTHKYFWRHTHANTHLLGTAQNTFSPQKFKEMPKCVEEMCPGHYLPPEVLCQLHTAEYNVAEVVSIRCAHIVSPSRFSPQSSGSSACYSLCAPSCLRVSIVKHQITWKNLNAKQVTCFREYP